VKTGSLREVKNHLSRVIEDLPKTGPMLITKNGQTRAVLLPVDERTDIESLVLSQNPRLWELIEKGVESGRRRGLKRLEDLPD
jgi:prevent-host-death family protein